MKVKRVMHEVIPIPEGREYEHLFGFNQCIRLENLLFICGQVPTDRDGICISPGIAAQCAQVIRNMRTVLHAAGVGFSHVLWLQSYVVDILRNGPIWQETLKQEVPDAQFVNAQIGVDMLADPAMLLEVMMIAHCK